MIYIAGPVTGFENGNWEAFEEARELIAGFTLASFKVDGPTYLDAARRNLTIPHDFVPSGLEWKDAMRFCIRVLTHADTLVCLPGSQDSKGARLEMKVARALGIPIYGLEQYLKHLEHERE